MTTSPTSLRDVRNIGEGGLMGMAVDPLFSTNRYIYTCMASNISGTNDVRVVRWTRPRNAAFSPGSRTGTSNDLTRSRTAIVGSDIPRNVMPPTDASEGNRAQG